MPRIRYPPADPDLRGCPCDPKTRFFDSRSAFVLVNQPTETVVSTNQTWESSEIPVLGIRGRLHRKGNSSFLGRNLLREPLMGAMAVVMTAVTTKDTLEMDFVHNEKVVEALRSDRANEPLGKCIRVWGPKGCVQDLGALDLEHFVEAGYVLGVTIPDQELGNDVFVGEVAGDVSSLVR
jgi:hypothetical protein